MGRLPQRTTTASTDAATLAAAAASALAPVGRARLPLWRSFVVGVGPGAPRFLSHRGASCPTDRALPCDCSAYASPHSNPTTIYGALVGGPNVADQSSSAAPGFFGYFDSRESYETNEPALDYNAGWLVTTMSLAVMDEPAMQPGTLAETTMSSASTPLPVSQNAANSDAYAWDSCFDLGLGTYPWLPNAFVTDLLELTMTSITKSRYEGHFLFACFPLSFFFSKTFNSKLNTQQKKKLKINKYINKQSSIFRYEPRGTGAFRRFHGWQPDGVLLMAAGLAFVAAVLAVSSVTASGGLGGGRQRKPTAAARAAAAAAAAKNGNNPAVAAAMLAAFTKPRTAKQQWFDGAVRLAAARNDVRMLDLLERYAALGGSGSSGIVGATGEAPLPSAVAAAVSSSPFSAARKTSSSLPKPGVVFDPNAALPDGFTALLAASAAAVCSPSKDPRSQSQQLPLPLQTTSMRTLASSESLPESAAALAARNRAAAAAAPPAPVFLHRTLSPAPPPPLADAAAADSSNTLSPPLPSTAVEFLLSRGADPRAKKRDMWGDTALHYAAAAGNVAVATALARAAPELLSTANFTGRTPAAVARSGRRDDVAAVLDDLEELGPIAELRDGTGSTRKARRARKAAPLMEGDKAAASVAAETRPAESSGGSGGGPAAAAAASDAGVKNAPGAAAGSTSLLPPAPSAAIAFPPPPRQPAPLTLHELALVTRFADRGRDGWGSIGTRPARGIRRFRIAAASATVAWAVYLTWRALRTLNDSRDVSRYAYSVVFWLIEFFGFTFWCPLVVCLWRQVERPPRNLHRMLLREQQGHLPGWNSAGGSELAGGGGCSGGGSSSIAAPPHPNSIPHFSSNFHGDELLSYCTASATVCSLVYPSAALLIACYSEPVEVIEVGFFLHSFFCFFF